MWLYQVLDITATLTESLGLYLFSICFCKEPRYRASVNRWLITGISFLCAYTLTWFSELGALKAPFLLTIYLVLLKVCYRDSVYQCAVAEELNYIATTMLSESIGMLIAHWIYQDQMFVLTVCEELMKIQIAFFEELGMQKIADHCVRIMEDYRKGIGKRKESDCR